MEPHNTFKNGKWNEEINVRDFIQLNYTPYTGDDSFLAEATKDTQTLWNQVEEKITHEVKTGEVEIDTTKFSGINNYTPGYIQKDIEKIVGLQTDKPLKRIVNPYGGYRMVQGSLEAYGATMDKAQEEAFSSYRKTHNEGVFDAYTKEMKLARSAGLLTGLPDAYGRGRIIGDYRRIALYGIDYLYQEKQKAWKQY